MNPHNHNKGSSKEEVLRKYCSIKHPYYQTIRQILDHIPNLDSYSFPQIDDILYYLLISKLRYLTDKTLGSDFFTSVKNRLKVPSEISSLTFLTESVCNSSVEIEEIISLVHETRDSRQAQERIDTTNRKSKGIFLTPYIIAQKIAREALFFRIQRLEQSVLGAHSLREIEEYLLEFQNLDILDPACGTGIILSATIQQLIQVYGLITALVTRRGFQIHSNIDNCIEELVNKHVFGIDIDPLSCLLTEIILQAKYGKSSEILKLNISVGNSLFPQGIFDMKNSTYLEHPTHFDILVMNPPYDRLKADRSEFRNVIGGEHLCKVKKQEIEQLVKRIKNCGAFNLSAWGELNLYKLFIDRSIQLTKNTGSIGFIVPLTILGDLSCTNLRKYVFDCSRITHIYCIPEKTKAFYGVSQAFCLMGLEKGGNTESVTVNPQVVSLRDFDNGSQFTISTEDIKKVSTHNFSIPITNENGWHILSRIHRFKKIGEIEEIRNLRGELDLTLFSKYIGTNPKDKLLIRGNMIQPYSMEVDDRRELSFVNYDDFSSALGASNKLRFIKPERIAGQQISNLGLRKRLKFALVKDVILGNSCNFLAIDESSDTNLNIEYLLGIVNSALLNWRFKLTSTNNHVNNYEIDDLPIVMPTRSAVDLKIEKLVRLQCQRYSDELQAEIDAMIFELYGLTKDESMFVLESDEYDRYYIELVMDSIGK